MNRDRRGRDRMVVGFTTTYAISDTAFFFFFNIEDKLVFPIS
jgi:hypothetical protein